MKTIKSSTKVGSAYINAYNRSTNFSLRDCYGSYSNQKAIAERECLSMMFKEKGEGFRILSFNTFHFTCGWKVGEDLRIETSSKSIIVKH